jgi:sporulation protein YtfJ
MEEHPINQLLDISLDKVIHMIDTQKIVGHPINLGNGRTLIPISKVTFGFGAGGSEFDSNKQLKKGIFNVESSEDLFPFGGGSAGGVSISPLAFIVVDNNEVSIMYSEKNESIYEKIFEYIKSFTKNKDKIE